MAWWRTFFPTELPPRTRRILADDYCFGVLGGTTSAHAENTGVMLSQIFGWWNYLRARGEYNTRKPKPRGRKELPPRTRRILASRYRPSTAPGTTSAHAENTRGQRNIRLTPGNYLRARGEYHLAEMISKGLKELPPRTRRILHRMPLGKTHQGTTSAHAENTRPSPRP